MSVAKESCFLAHKTDSNKWGKLLLASLEQTSAVQDKMRLMMHTNVHGLLLN